MNRIVQLLCGLAAAACLGCAAERRTTYSTAALSTLASAPEILRVASTHLSAHGYRLYAGNPGLDIMASQEADTWWTPGACILGVAVTPLFIITMPIAAILPIGEGRMWWPLGGLAIVNASTISRNIHVEVSPEPDGWNLVEIRSASQDEQGHADAHRLEGVLTVRLLTRQASAGAFSPSITDSTR